MSRTPQRSQNQQMNQCGSSQRCFSSLPPPSSLPSPTQLLNLSVSKHSPLFLPQLDLLAVVVPAHNGSGLKYSSFSFSFYPNPVHHPEASSCVVFFLFKCVKHSGISSYLPFQCCWTNASILCLTSTTGSRTKERKEHILHIILCCREIQLADVQLLGKRSRTLENLITFSWCPSQCPAGLRCSVDIRLHLQSEILRWFLK